MVTSVGYAGQCTQRSTQHRGLLSSQSTFCKRLLGKATLKAAWRASCAQRCNVASCAIGDSQSTADTDQKDLIFEASVPCGRLEVRRLKPDEAQMACVVMTKAFATTDEDINLTGAMGYTKTVLQAGEHKGAFLIARLFPNDPALLPPRSDSRVVGTVVLCLDKEVMQPCPSLPPPDDGAYLSNMAVDTKLRRQGIGRTLLEASDRVTKDAGYGAIYLHVKQDDPVPQALYLSAGYQEVSRDGMLVKLKGIKPRILMRRTLA